MAVFIWTSAHAAARNGHQDTKDDYCKKQQNDSGCQGSNLAARLLPTTDAKNEGCNRNNEYKTDDERKCRKA